MCKAWQLIFSCFSLCALVKRCLLFLLNILLYSHKRKPTPIQNIKTSFKEGTTTKNINTYILIAIVSLILVVAWAAGKAGLLELDYEERTARRNAHAAA